MKYLMRMKNESGFSLVELMVSVGIIGVMSSVAVPKYQKFRANAAQSEAQSTLSSIYTLQQLRFVEDSAYTSVLGTGAGGLGYVPSNDSRYDYATKAYKKNGTADGDASDSTRFKATAASKAALASCIAPTTGDLKDRWCVNENKTLTNDESVSASTLLPCEAGDNKDVHNGGC